MRVLLTVLCVGACAASDAPSHVDTVAASADWSQRVATLRELGWQVAPLASAREAQDDGRWRVEVDAHKGALAIDLVYVHEDGGEQVVVRPHDQASAKAFTEGGNLDPTPDASDVAEAVGYCDEGCYPPPDRVCNCQYWYCEYIESISYTWGCIYYEEWGGNPFGQTFNFVMRSGNTDPASCAGWWSDIFGNTKVCPWPAKNEYHWSVCSQFIDG